MNYNDSDYIVAVKNGEMIGFSKALWQIFTEMYENDPKWAFEDITSTLHYFLRCAKINANSEIMDIRSKVYDKFGRGY